MIRVVAPSRLHFGLFHVPTAGKQRPGERVFGGVGLMIDTPGRRRHRETGGRRGSSRDRSPAGHRRSRCGSRSRSRSPSASRFRYSSSNVPRNTPASVSARNSAWRWRRRWRLRWGERSPIGRTRGPRWPRRAVGDRRSRLRPRWAARGRREARGRGRVAADRACPVAGRVACRAVHAIGPGRLARRPRERDAFAAAAGGDPDALRRIAETAILPAAQAGDLEAFGEAVHEFNRRAGEPFAAAQGGPYASPAIAELIADVQTLGVRGVGQSSWGPTVFAVVADSDTALSLVLRFRSRMPVAVARVSARAIKREGG